MRYHWRNGRMVPARTASRQDKPRRPRPCIVGTRYTFSKGGNVLVSWVKQSRA